MAPSPPPTARPGSVAAWRAVKDLETLAPDLGWPEATALVDAVIEGLAHRLVDVAAGRAKPSTLPLPAPSDGGQDGPADHASCRGAAARLRAARPALLEDAEHRPWAATAAGVAGDLAELLDQVADRSRAGRRRPTDKSVALRRLHGLRRQLR